MSESKHTPGPWVLGTNVNKPNHIEAADPLMRGNGNLVRIAVVFEIDPNVRQHEANAHLIAAAPELLEALKDALDLMERTFERPAPNGQIVKARAAISKAEGR